MVDQEDIGADLGRVDTSIFVADVYDETYGTVHTLVFFADGTYTEGATPLLVDLDRKAKKWVVVGGKVTMVLAGMSANGNLYFQAVDSVQKAYRDYIARLILENPDQ